MIHTISTQWYKLDTHTTQWQILNIMDSLCRWCVPIFVMVTGMLLLNPEKEISISTIFKKYIKRIAILFLFWSITFTLLDQINATEKLTFETFIEKTIEGHYHLWYLYMLMGLYLITPIIKTFIQDKNKKLIEYFLILWFIFQGIFHVITVFKPFVKFQPMVSNFNMTLAMGYVGYYILGYYLNKYPPKRIFRIIIYFLALISIYIIVKETRYFVIEHYELRDTMYNYLSGPVCVTAMAIFMLVKQLFEGKKIEEKAGSIIRQLTKLSFAVYLIHPAFFIIMEKNEITILKYPLAISVLMYTTVIYLLSLAISFILSKIPIVNKYLV